MRLPTRNTRGLIFGFLMLVLTLPGLNLMFPVIASGELEGAVSLAADTSFTPSAWLDGSYQRQKELYLNDHIGFRTDLVRINNQIDFSLFRKLHARDVVLGKDCQLFEAGYIRAYYGEKYLGEEKIAMLMRKLRFVQDSMSRAGKALILAFVPSKARYYPEHFPDDMVQAFTPRSNYLSMKEAAGSHGINLIDLNGWFLKLKASAPHPLFSKMGIHWTHWGADYAADSLNRVMERLLRIDMPEIRFGEPVCTTERRGENDVERALNLIWPVQTEELCYNQLSFDEANKTKPDVVFIGDSFFWSILDDGIPQHTYSTFHFWTYFSEMWNDQTLPGHGQPGRIADTDWKAIIARSDAVVLFYTETNLPRYEFEFIEDMYREYGGR